MAELKKLLPILQLVGVVAAVVISLLAFGVVRLPMSAASGWSYHTNPYLFETKRALRACAGSTNQVKLPFPGQETTADLCVREWPGHGLDSYIRFAGSDKVACGNADCIANIRFDDRPAQSFLVSGGTDGSVFIRQPQQLLRDIEGSSKTTIELPLQGGAQTLSFPTNGLKWPPPAQAIDRVTDVIAYLVVLIWFAMPVAVSLVTGDTLLGFKTCNRQTNPKAYWRGVRFWCLVFLCAFCWFSANLLYILRTAA